MLKDVGRIGRTAMAFVLRLLLRLPLILLAHVAWGIAAMFESIGDGLDLGQASLRQIANAPFVHDWHAQIAAMEESKRLDALKAINGRVDV